MAQVNNRSIVALVMMLIAVRVKKQLLVVFLFTRNPPSL